MTSNGNKVGAHKSIESLHGVPPVNARHHHFSSPWPARLRWRWSTDASEFGGATLHHAPCAIHSSPWILQFQVLFITFVFASFTVVIFPLFSRYFTMHRVHHRKPYDSVLAENCRYLKLGMVHCLFYACITCFDNVPESLEFFSYVLTALINVPSRCNLSINANPIPLFWLRIIAILKFRNGALMMLCCLTCIDNVPVHVELFSCMFPALFHVPSLCILTIANPIPLWLRIVAILDSGMVHCSCYALPYVHRQCTCTSGILFLCVSRIFFTCLHYASCLLQTLCHFFGWELSPFEGRNGALFILSFAFRASTMYPNLCIGQCICTPGVS